MQKIFFLFVITLFSSSLLAQYTSIWGRTIGGSNWDEASCVIETSDGCIVVGGYLETGEKDFGTAGYVVSEVKRGNRYPWLVKFTPDGQEIWGRSFQDSYHAQISDVVQLPDSSFAVAGICYNDRWLTTDAWIAKLDKEGNKVWEKKFGAGKYNEGANSLSYDAADGGFVLAGFTEFNTEIEKDGWLIKVDNQGNMLWDQIWGGKKADELYRIKPTKDGGSIAVGYASSGGAYKSTWVLKSDASGNYEWDENFIHSVWDVGTSITETFDGGYAVCGFTKVGNQNNYDVRVIKLDNLGTKQWDFTYGDVEWEEATDIVETYDRGYAVSAFTRNVGGQFDKFWILYINRNGELEWEEQFGGKGYDYATNIVETKDKGLVIAGSSYANEHMGWDFAVLKLTRDGISDYLLPQIKVSNPLDTISTVDYSSFLFEACIRSIDSLKNIQVYYNDSLFLDNVPFNYSRADSTCNTMISVQLNLKEGENRVYIKATNVAGTSTSYIYRIFYILIFRLGHW